MLTRRWSTLESKVIFLRRFFDMSNASLAESLTAQDEGICT